MLPVPFALNFGLFRTFMEAGREGVYATEGYRLMLEAFLGSPFFIDGVTRRTLPEQHPRVIRALDLVLEARDLVRRAAEGIP